MRAVIVTGDRYAIWEDWEHAVHGALVPGDVVIHGGATGIDAIAASHERAISIPAQWKKLGKPAGPRRNAAMLRVLLVLRDHGYEVRVFAFHESLEQSKGTKDMVTIAVDAGVETWCCWRTGCQVVTPDYVAEFLK